MHKDRYYLLDAMRGVAALLVVFFHAGSFTQTNYAAKGYLAVDFFFALSGFVIAMSYGGRLRGGLSVWRFTLMRLIRFYPLFVLGLALGVTKALGALFFADAQAISIAQITLSALWGIVMLPTLFAPHELFPLNGPAWSLFLEFAMSIAFAAWFVRWRDSSLVFLAVVSATAMTIFVIQTGTLHGGWAWSTFGVGVARITFAFTVGVLLARYKIHIERRVSWLALLPITALVLTCSVAVYDAFPVDLIIALIVCPAILYLGIAFEVPPSMHGVSRFLGQISFPVYAVHFPLMFIFNFAVRKVGVPGELTIWLFIPCLFAGCSLLFHLFDVPVRRYLSDEFIKRRPPEIQHQPTGS
ncbi:acyltransferase family protein [Phyllobacterium zundukense]|nr:acyltransferase [Phyllobacterium zundukense]ATU91711.1 hypothetical protein BLM14_08805 [Phyllobacterium zundukense]